jgi:hypothetical protein
MYKYIFIFLLTLPVLAAGQSLKGHTYTWTAQKVYDFASDTVLSQPGIFISYSFEKFEMVQYSTTFTFAVTSRQGDWKDISQTGQMVFSVKTNNQPGIITVGRDDGGIYLVLDMTPAQPTAIKSKYFISSLTLHE